MTEASEAPAAEAAQAASEAAPAVATEAPAVTEAAPEAAQAPAEAPAAGVPGEPPVEAEVPPDLELEPEPEDFEGPFGAPIEEEFHETPEDHPSRQAPGSRPTPAGPEPRYPTDEGRA